MKTSLFCTYFSTKSCVWGVSKREGGKVGEKGGRGRDRERMGGEGVVLFNYERIDLPCQHIQFVSDLYFVFQNASHIK